MGWQTQIIYIVEDLKSEQEAVNLAHEIFEYEGKFFHWFGFSCYLRKKKDGYWDLFYYYEKRVVLNL